MEVNILALIRTAHLFADVLSELKYRDGWLSFGPEFAKFVIDRKIDWWELYENAAILRLALPAVLLRPEQWKRLADEPNKREAIAREFLALAEDSSELGKSFEAEAEAALGKTPATTEHQKEAMERVELLFAGFVGNLYNYLAVTVFGHSLCQLVALAKEGNDGALITAAQVDRTVLNLPYFQQRVARAQLTGDGDFLDKLSYRLRNPILRTKLRHPDLRLAFAILQDEGLLEPGKRLPYGKLMDQCRDAGVYKGDDVDAFRKTLTEYLRAQRTRKDF
ncbi:MAG: hypothetical protein KGL98_07920 [Gammaproteobacteria bacterium]|nr:hypothetical protein [Gammaproteobacteria bacterium]